ncbi:MAG TPA: hypothetical protein PKA13_11260 [Geminicoccaceae bacterium]|mgnify:CR=1 FL=1|nr:hypothetical protein [Geminicoccus sp.]HMU50342.1 hypothetical protein [Geminicoccaceae bacterium]
MSWPDPQPGLVIRYAYLWEREACSGREEGVKDRPCAVILAHVTEDGRTRVYVLPITHSPPADEATEIPIAVKRHLGLDAERSWIVLTEANSFLWPGPDLRLLPGKGPESAAYGFLPPRFFRMLRDRFLALRRQRLAKLVARTE